MAAIGLQSHIWNNNLKSIGLLFIYPFVIGAMVWAITYICVMSGMAPGIKQTPEQLLAFTNSFVFAYWPIILTVVCIWFVVSYFFQSNMVRALSHSHPVTRKDEPELYNLLENLCIAQGMTMPRLEIIETHARNAFASGVNDKTYCVTVTRGLLQSLSKDEVEGVLAHELTHIINRDVRLLIVTIIFTSMIGFAAQIAWSMFRYSLWVPRRSSNGKGNGGVLLLLGILAVLWIGYFATIFTRFALSRRREYMADAGAIQMTKNPEAMMRALIRISGMDAVPKMPDDVNMMCIENRKPFMGMFATHPPIDKRIEAISQTTNTPVPAIQPKIRASRADAFTPPAEGRANWITRERFKERRSPWG